jgi:hypothetical protein
MDAESRTRERVALSRYLEQTRAKRSHAEYALPLRERGADVEATSAQQQLWLHSELASGSPIYNEPVTIHFHGDLNGVALERALNEILRRHEAWRTGFRWSGEKLVQRVRSELSIDLPVTDLRSLPKRRREVTAIQLATEDAKLPFDLAHPPLLRPLLVRLGESEHGLFLTLHHIIFDAYSLYQIFLPELHACYDAFSRGSKASLPPLRAQYPDYALWQKRSFRPSAVEPHLLYWETQLSGQLPILNLSPDRPLLVNRTNEGAMAAFALPLNVVDRLKEIGVERGATLYMTLLAAFNVLLYSETSQCDVIVGSASSSRKHPETEKMLGYFLNTIVLRTRFSPKEHFLDLIARVREVVIGALSHDDLPFELLVSRFEKHRRPGVHPLFQVMFSLGPPLRHLPPGWEFTKTDVDTGAAKMDLWLDLDEREDGLIGRFLYSAELFDSLTISRLSKKWIILLDTISKEPNEGVASLARFLRENNLRSSDVATHLGKRSKWYAPNWARSLWPGVDG